MEANREHLALLMSGVDRWNAWRKQNPYIIAPDLEDSDLRGLDLRLVDFSKTNLCAVALSDANLEGASLVGANLSGTRLTNAVLRSVNFDNASFNGTDCSSADFSDSNLTGVFLRNVNCENANLEWTYLAQAVFRRANLKGARFRGAHLATGFDDVDLGHVQGLDEVMHVGPSSFGIDTLYRSAGKLPQSFLRDAGVPENFLAYADSLTVRPIEFQSCFISYATSDESFANKLYRDLRREGIRCWFAPESLKIGDRFRREIDRSILVHDRLLVILLAASLASAWVEEEVEAALEREHKTKLDVLFPVRIDDEVMGTDTAWAAALRRMRHIGDFRGWTEPDRYGEARNRLLRDLRIGHSGPA